MANDDQDKQDQIQGEKYREAKRTHPTEIFGLLMGGYPPANKHESLLSMMIGALLGTLAIDAAWNDGLILSHCRYLLDNERRVSDLDITDHALLALTMLQPALTSLAMLSAATNEEVVQALQKTLVRIRAAAADPSVIAALGTAAEKARQAAGD